MPHGSSEFHKIMRFSDALNNLGLDFPNFLQLGFDCSDPLVCSTIPIVCLERRHSNGHMIIVVVQKLGSG